MAIDPDSEQPTPRKTVLVVDDAPENITVLGELLASHYHVRVATTGERALRAARTEPRPDLVLLDLVMPGMDGYEIFSRLREAPDTRLIPVIFVTGQDSPDTASHLLSQGAAGCLGKPVHPAGVLEQLRRVLGQG